MRNLSAQVKNIEKLFNLDTQESNAIVKAFLSEMSAGLSGEKSSLKMLPAYVGKANGNQQGVFIALDLGGTNFRVLLLELQGRGRLIKQGEAKFTLTKKQVSGDSRLLFGFLADCIRRFSRSRQLSAGKKYQLGFTFSFPVKQTAVNRGKLIHWTKGFSAKGVVGADVVKLLAGALRKSGVNNIKISALANDTVGTLVAQSYKDKNCDAGVIIGTGTNACYIEKSRKNMIVNIEWGNFDQLKTNIYDFILDESSNNSATQRLEKMVSGMYLGELTRLVLKEHYGSKFLALPYEFKAEYMSEIVSDHSRSYKKSGSILKKFGIFKSNIEERRAVKKICGLIAARSAKIGAAALAAVIMHMDGKLKNKHTIAVDGSVFEKYPGYAAQFKNSLDKILGQKKNKVKLVLTKDGSGIGAAIIAAIAG